MSTVNCYGIHSDEVGLRYLVQDSISNAYGFSKQEPFKVETPFSINKCPHNFKITAKTSVKVCRTSLVASPIPHKNKLYVADKDEDLDLLASFSNAHILPLWMLNGHILRHRAYTSNITTLIIQNCTNKHSELLNEIQETNNVFMGKIIFQGDYYFSHNIERLKKLPKDLTSKKAKENGQIIMSNYLREKDS